MGTPARPPRALAGTLGWLFPLLACAGLAFWFVVGLPWGPHNESFDWIVRLETRSFAGALFERFPSVLSLRPLGTGSAWVLYRLGGHDVGLAQVANALIALLAWGWAARGIRELRLFSVLALVVGGVFFAGYIWAFHLHGIFYGPLLMYLVVLLRAARGPLDVRTLLGVFVAGVLTALAHPYALPLLLAFALGAVIETPLLRTRAGVGALVVVFSGAVATYLLLVPGGSRDLGGMPLAGLVTSFHTLEVNAVGSAVAGLLAAWTATRALPGVGGAAAAVLTLLLTGAGIATGMPVLPLWIMWAAVKSLRHKRWTLAALIGASALLPVPNPTGSPTYAIFAVLAATFATACDEGGSESWLHVLRPLHVTVVLALLLVVALGVRAGLPVPIVSRIARPLFAEAEHTRQFEVVVQRLMTSQWRGAHGRFLHPAQNPSDADAVDRRFRPPTDDAHLGTWLDWKRGGPPTLADTLVFTFGGETMPNMDTLFVARGRYAGDALVLRGAPIRSSADSLSTQSPR